MNRRCRFSSRVNPAVMRSCSILSTYISSLQWPRSFLPLPFLPAPFLYHCPLLTHGLLLLLLPAASFILCCPPSPLSRHHLSCCLPSLPSHYLIFLPVTSPAGSATIAMTLGRARQWHLAAAEGPCGAARQQSVASAMHGAMRGRAQWLRQHRRFLNQR